MSGLTTNNMSTLVENSLYEQLASTFQDMEMSGETATVQTQRKEAFARFRELGGFPTVKNEDWKYTNIHRLVNKTYVLNQDVDVSKIDLSAADIPGLDAHRIVLINGQYVLAFSSIEDEIGLTVKPIEEAQNESAFQEHFAKHADATGSATVALNTALHTSGLYLEVNANKIVSKPIQIVHVATGQEDFFVQTRNLFVAGKNAEIEIIESFIALDGAAKNLNNKVTEIVLQENAKVQHYYLQLSDINSHYINHVEVYQEQYSLYNNYNCNFPGVAFVRNDFNVRLDAENVESHLYGINLLADEQFVDNHTVVDHMKPNCESYEWYKNIPQDKAIAVFNGKIFVREDAQKTNAFQQNNNMLIGEESTVYTKPQLEIFADDVKCSHGCTMGQFDEEALFYLRSRGIAEESARILLVHAFAFDVTTRFSNETVRHYVEKLIEQGLEDN